MVSIGTNTEDMNKLEELALRHIISLSNETATEIIDTGILITHGGETKFSEKEHIYPIHGKIGDIKQWAEAILENNEDKP